VVNIIQRAREAMNRRAYEEALGLMVPIEGDARSLNPRAVCYYNMGNTEEAIRLWRQAAEQGDEDARQNLIQVTR
jgi:Flp pilus assembly protein TadD